MRTHAYKHKDTSIKFWGHMLKSMRTHAYKHKDTSIKFWGHMLKSMRTCTQSMRTHSSKHKDTSFKVCEYTSEHITESYFWILASHRKRIGGLVSPWRDVCCTPRSRSSRSNMNTKLTRNYCNSGMSLSRAYLLGINPGYATCWSPCCAIPTLWNVYEHLSKDKDTCFKKIGTQA